MLFEKTLSFVEKCFRPWWCFKALYYCGESWKLQTWLSWGANITGHKLRDLFFIWKKGARTKLLEKLLGKKKTPSRKTPRQKNSILDSLASEGESSNLDKNGGGTFPLRLYVLEPGQKLSLWMMEWAALSCSAILRQPVVRVKQASFPWPNAKNQINIWARQCPAYQILTW